VFRTTVVGSHPAGSTLAEAVADQLAAGIDLLSDGQTRGDMLSAFLRAIPGCVQRPDGRWAVVERLGAPDAAICVADWVSASALASSRPVKGILTGPTTLACAVTVAPGAPYAGPGAAALVRDFAEILAAEAAALAGAGARIIQVDEPFFSVGADVALGLSAVRRVVEGVAEPWLHCCGDVRSAWPLLRMAPVSVLQIESTCLDRLPAIGDGVAPQLGFGVIDSTTDAVERLEQVALRITQLQQRGAPADGWLSPDCGLRLRSRAAAQGKLTVLADAARRA
jgi:5-methyltetrahydropteroyltriglutamate--homocysteine methyltransferase